jgi:hypothetical protein
VEAIDFYRRRSAPGSYTALTTVAWLICLTRPPLSVPIRGHFAQSQSRTALPPTKVHPEWLMAMPVGPVTSLTPITGAVSLVPAHLGRALRAATAAATGPLTRGSELSRRIREFGLDLLTWRRDDRRRADVCSLREPGARQATARKAGFLRERRKTQTPKAKALGGRC